MMRITMAKWAGYCFGIKNAMKLAENVLSQRDDLPVCALGDLSHNAQEIERLHNKGLITHQHIEDVQQPCSLIIRSHGVGKDELEEAHNKGLKVIDATCPFVTALHNKIEKFHNKGYQIVIVGDALHPEVVGAMGWCNHEGVVIGSLAEVHAQNFEERVCVVAQTTLIEDMFYQIAEAIELKAKETIILNTICSATAERQAAAAEVAKGSDYMIVIGGYHSSNTKKLAEICRTYCKNTCHIETAGALNPNEIKKYKFIGITAGASTPDWIIKEVTDRMEEVKKELEQQEEVVEREEEDIVTEEVMPTEAEEVEATESVDAPEEEVEAAEEVVETEEVAEEATESEEPEAAEEVAVEEVAEEAEASEEAEETAEAEEEEATDSADVSDAEFDFEAEIEESLKPIRKGTTLEGEVILVDHDEVILNIAYKADGVIKKNDYTWKQDDELEDLVKVGDKVTAIVVDLNDGAGRVKLSKIRYDNKKVQIQLAEAFENRTILEGTVKAVSGGGLIVDIGFTDIFMPASQYHVRYIKDLTTLIGKEVKGVIIDYNARRRRAILSQKVLIEKEIKQRQEEMREAKEKRFAELELDQIVDGKVKTITNFGIFVDLDGIDGFVHRSDLTWLRANDPKTLVEKGQDIQAKVINRNEEDKKIKLSVKALQEKPMDQFVMDYKEGQTVDVRITNILDFGAFAEIIPGVEGLIHISEIAYEHIESVATVLSTGETVSVKIIGIDKERERISLSIKATKEAPERQSRPRRSEKSFNRGSGSSYQRSDAPRRRQPQSRNKTVYEESADNTIGDAFGSILGSLSFDDEDEE
jgi:4-hydroxy-3-methylbut-2-enyl diphosphate reductase